MILLGKHHLIRLKVMEEDKEDRVERGLKCLIGKVTLCQKNH